MPANGSDRRSQRELLVSVRDAVLVWILLFSCWLVSLSLFGDELLEIRPKLIHVLQPAMQRHLLLAAGVSGLIGFLFFLIRLRGFIEARVNPSNLDLFEKLTDDLPCLLYQFRQWPTGRSSVTYSTAAMETIYELDRRAARRDGAQIFKLVHPDDSDRIWAALVLSHQTLAPWREEFRVVLPNAGVRWRLGQARVERLPDGGTLWHGFVIDITAEKRTEELLAAAKNHAEEANAHKTRFLAMMSHDIRTPMTGVLGFSQLLKESDLQPEQREYADAIEQSARSLLLLINDILDISRIEAGELALNPETFSVRHCLGEVLTLIRRRLEEKGLALDVRIPESMPDIIVTDRTRLFQVLTNLLGNATKFTTVGGITLEADFQARAGHDPLWSFRVSDTGPGISARDRDRIFDFFQRQERDRKHEGAGLGLAITRQICRCLGGDVALTDTDGPGATFLATIAAPTAENPSPASASPQIAETGERKARVLLVEDNPLNAKLARLILQRLGCEVVLAESGERAIEACQTQSFDTVLMDMELPGITGIEATRALRSLEAEGRTSSPGPLRIVALTANALTQDREACLSAGMDDFLSKPIDTAQLRRILWPDA